MRKKSLAAFVAIALTVAIGFSVIGQEEPLPVVTPKYVAPEVRIVEPLIVLASEPIRDYRPPTILDAARNNDYVTFDALYTAAQRRGEDVKAWDTLHELWTYSITDPIGAFYGVELYEKLSRAYPGFAAYIEPYRIVDNNGQVFYPTSETRTFLLARAAEGRRAPKVLVAEDRPAPPKPAQKVLPKPVPVVQNPPVVEAPVAAEPPVVIEAEPAPQPVAVAQAPVVNEPVAVAETPVVKEPIATPAPAPVKTTANTATTTAPTTRAPAGTRGILLMIIGLIGIGLLAVILRTPKEEPMIVRPSSPSNVEPLRKPQTAPPPPSSDTRAAG